MATPSQPIVDDPSVGTPIVGDPGAEPSPSPDPEPIEPNTTGEPEADPEPGTQPEPSVDSPEDARKLPGYIRSLKESDPKAYAKAKTEFFDLNARRSVHPTVQAAREEHELLSSLGGQQGVAKLREDGQFFKSAAQQFLKGDKAFVDDLWTEDAIAAELHVPHMLEAYRTKNFDGYATTLAQLWDSEFKNVGFDGGLQYLEAAINAGDKAKQLDALKQFRDWKTSITETARRAPSPREKALLAERTKQVETREQGEKDEFLKGYRTEAVNAVVNDGAKVFDSYFKDRKLDAEDRKDLLREVFALATRNLLAAEPGFEKERDAHLTSGNSAAAVKLSQARYAKYLPEAVKRIARRYGMNAGPKPVAGQPAAGGKQPAAPVQGFSQVNALPNPEDIDRAKSTKEMLHSGRAILKNGRKVSWAHLRAQVA